MYKPLYFDDGQAIHGSDIVPPEPLSKGCAPLLVEHHGALLAWLGLLDATTPVSGAPTASTSSCTSGASSSPTRDHAARFLGTFRRTQSLGTPEQAMAPSRTDTPRRQVEPSGSA